MTALQPSGTRSLGLSGYAKKLTGDLGDYLVNTYDAEQIVGGRFWDRISGGDLHDKKRKPAKMW